MFRLIFIQMLAKRLLRKRATLQDVYRLYQVVCRTPKILAILKDLDCVTINDALCGPLVDVLKVSARTIDILIKIQIHPKISIFTIGIDKVPKHGR